MSYSRIVAWAGSFLIGIAISVFFLIQFRADLPQIVADYIDKYLLREIEDRPLTQTEIDVLQVSEHHEFGIWGGSPEFQGLQNAYGTTKLTPPERPSRSPPNYREDSFKVLPPNAEVRAIFWPKDCNNDGCRYDIFRPSLPELMSAEQFVGTIRAHFLRSSSGKRNGLPIFVDGDRRAHWWDGSKFRVDPSEIPQATESRCTTWIATPESAYNTVGRNISLAGVLAVQVTGAHFLMRGSPLCWKSGVEKYIQHGGNEIQLLSVGSHDSGDEFLSSAMEFVGEIDVRCNNLYVPETPGYDFGMACDANSITGDTLMEEHKTISAR